MISRPYPVILLAFLFAIHFTAGTAEAQTEEESILERMFESQVKRQEGVATVWANYDLYVDGTFSHCGVDTFTLVESPEGWKVASRVYTVETEGCPERPPIPSN